VPRLVVYGFERAMKMTLLLGNATIFFMDFICTRGNSELTEQLLQNAGDLEKKSLSSSNSDSKVYPERVDVQLGT